MEYEVIYFDNFEQFKEENATLAFELLESLVEGRGLDAGCFKFLSK